MDFGRRLESPLTIDNRELQVSRLALKCSECDASGRTKHPPADAYSSHATDAMMTLTELSRDVANFLYGNSKFKASRETYLIMRRLDRQLDRWHATLHPAFKQSPSSDARSGQFVFLGLQYTIALNARVKFLGSNILAV
jgi:hypothetical protein